MVLEKCPIQEDCIPVTKPHSVSVGPGSCLRVRYSRFHRCRQFVAVIVPSAVSGCNLVNHLSPPAESVVATIVIYHLFHWVDFWNKNLKD